MIENQITPIRCDCEQYYQKLHDKCGDILTLSLEADSGQFSECHHFILDFEKWIDALSGRPEVDLLKLALNDYQFSLLAIIQGQYRQAFMALRLFLELSLGSIHFSANELHFRVWEKNQKDIIWNTLIDSENGVLSDFFAKAFYEDLSEEVPHCREIARKVYRECSEYVHGNAKTYEFLPSKLEFVESIFLEWQSKCQSIKYVINFALCLRYLKFIEIGSDLEQIILDELGHLSEIRLFFGATTEENYE